MSFLSIPRSRCKVSLRIPENVSNPSHKCEATKNRLIIHFYKFICASPSYQLHIVFSYRIGVFNQKFKNKQDRTPLLKKSTCTSITMTCQIIVTKEVNI